MKRPRGGLTAYPADAEVKDDNVIYNMSEREAGEVYSKLLLANCEDILSIIAREFGELEAQIADDENCPEKCFIEQAVALLKERETKVLGKIEIGGGIDNEIAGSNCKANGIDVLDEGVVEVGDLVDSLNISQNPNQQSKFHYFYQG